MTYGVSITKACQALSVTKSTYYYRPTKSVEDEQIKTYLLALAQQYPQWGFDKMRLKAKQESKPWNHKRLYRIYCENHLNLRVKKRKRHDKGEASVLLQPIDKNRCWSVDFMSDVLLSGQTFRTFNVLDDYHRGCLLIEPSYSIPSMRVTQLLDQVAVGEAYPEKIRVDHGPEFTSKHFVSWAKERGIEIDYIQPGKPAQNGYIERFNRSYRTAVLDRYLFKCSSSDLI